VMQHGEASSARRHTGATGTSMGFLSTTSQRTLRSHQKEKTTPPGPQQPDSCSSAGGGTTPVHNAARQPTRRNVEIRLPVHQSHSESCQTFGRATPNNQGPPPQSLVKGKGKGMDTRDHPSTTIWWYEWLSNNEQCSLTLGSRPADPHSTAVDTLLLNCSALWTIQLHVSNTIFKQASE
jgi:hypothetical protein